MRRVQSRGMLWGLLFAMALALSACNAAGTTLTFSFQTSVPSQSSDEQRVTIQAEQASLTLNADLTIDAGACEVRVVDAESRELVWSERFEQNMAFSIPLQDVKAGQAFLIQCSATDAQDVKLVITAKEKLGR